MAALRFAEGEDYSSPGAWIASAAGWMGGSLAPSGCDPVEPASSLPGEAVLAALTMAAARVPERYERSIGKWVHDALGTFGGKGGAS